MARHRKCRNLQFHPRAAFFKPAGIPIRSLSEVSLNPDEIEVIRYIDVEHLDQNKTAEKLGVSRITVQRIYKSARNKIGFALTEGQALRLNNRIRGCGCRFCEITPLKGGE